jgi:anti-sigma factor (TIGR02949 family)
MSAPARSQLEGLGLSSTCVDVLRHLWDYLDDEITPAGAERLRKHIESCAQCREFEGFQTCFLDSLAHLRRELDAPATVRDRLAEKLRHEGCKCWEQARKRE